MKMNVENIDWLALHFPNLQYNAKLKKIVGELDFHAAYDSESGKLIMNREEAREVELYLYDAFEIEICLDVFNMNKWPKIYEVGGRHHQIAKQNNISLADLHFYTDDDNCCLGIEYGNKSGVAIEVYFYELVIPFFYRLSYIERFGIDDARKRLWDEYAHGTLGLKQYEMELFKIERQHPIRFGQCPCKSGKKYIDCHFSQVEYLKQKLDKLCFCGNGRKYRNCHFRKKGKS